jgi:27-O-demethylrifamycin SV methyltransferase
VADPTYDAAAHYDRVSAAWSLLLGEDLHYGLFRDGDEALRDATEELTRTMAEAARIEPGLAVLDVGCGTGAPALHLAARHGARVVGITTSERGLERARARAAEEGVDDLVTFELRDGMDNGLPTGSFDRVWVLESSHLMRERELLMRECARVLRTGGRLALCDIMLRRRLDFEEVRRLREPLVLLRRVFGDARMEPLSRYTELARSSGLTVEREHDLTAATRPTFDRWRANAERHRDDVTASLGDAYLERFVRACDVLEALWDDGTMGYGLLAAVKR